MQQMQEYEHNVLNQDPHDEEVSMPVVVPILDDDDTAQDDNPHEIFKRAVSEIETQPLPKEQQDAVCWPLVFVTAVLLVAFVGGTLIALLTYPSVIITVVPVTKSVALTTSLALPTRTLAPVTLPRSLTAPTTGKGHQDARAATGTLILYNGLFTAQTLAGGTLFTAQNGVQVATDTAVSVPAANPPQFAAASVPAHALKAGLVGNIAAGAIATTLANGVLVKNRQFAGGRQARDFPAVAQADLDKVAAMGKHTLTQQMPQAFPLASGEQVFPIGCRFTVTPNHPVGAEATAITVTVRETCTGVAYNSEMLTQQATTRFTQQTMPGANSLLVGEVQVQVVSANPLTVACRGLWASTLPQDYEQFLAQQIAGDSPQQAQQYLLHTGMLISATVPGKLPRDPAHIHFQVLIGK